MHLSQREQHLITPISVIFFFFYFVITSAQRTRVLTMRPLRHKETVIQRLFWLVLPVERMKSLKILNRLVYLDEEWPVLLFLSVYVSVQSHVLPVFFPPT